MLDLQDVITGYRATFQKQQLAAMATMKRLKDFVYWLYFQYMLITVCIDLEPWEQIIVHLSFATLVAVLAFTACVFSPIHLCLAIWIFLQSLFK